MFLVIILLFQISGRLFSDSAPRRSSRLSGDASVNANPNTTVVSGNGTGYSSKHLGGSKPSSMAFRSVTVRKGQPWANENIDEGDKTLYIAHSILLYNCVYI
jgi:anaphase-promoting complex subunit 3